MDFFETDKINYHIVVDAYSKWLEVIPMRFTTSLKTIDPSRTLVTRYGIPEDLASDNGPQLAAEEFTKFMRQNWVKFTRVSPYHPASKGWRSVPYRKLKWL